MSQNLKWVFIINPIAGDGYALSLTDKLKEMIRKYSLDADMVYTTGRGHATTLAKQYADDGYKYIIAVGGDGTFNEVATPLVSNKDVITGIIGAGTANDFILITGFPGRFREEDWENFFKANVISMDVGRCNEKAFFLGIGIGFDAEVAALNYDESGVEKPGGKQKYIGYILRILLFYKEKRMIILSGGKKTETDCFMNTIANGRRFGGGFLLTPKAIANDGLLDVCSIRKLSLPQRIRLLLKAAKGTHINDKTVNYYRTDKLSLEFPSEVPFHVDGELFFSKNFEVSTLPGALNVIYNTEGDHYFKDGLH
jgi:YegS/Rv2252/BmrU family lipid kinase